MQIVHHSHAKWSSESVDAGPAVGARAVAQWLDIYQHMYGGAARIPLLY
jgi:hypothetical protein